MQKQDVTLSLKQIEILERDPKKNITTLWDKIDIVCEIMEEIQAENRHDIKTLGQMIVKRISMYMTRAEAFQLFRIAMNTRINRDVFGKV